MKTHLKWLYTYEEYPELEIPNTTNLLEGFNSQLKRALRNHNGMKEVNKKEVHRWVPEYKKVGWNYQPTKCPLLKHERFSAYQMSITPKICIKWKK